MRIAGLIISLASVVLLVRVAWIGWQRSSFYDAKYWNTISTTTPGATVSLAEHADLAQKAMHDADSLGLQASIGAALALCGAVVSTAGRRAASGNVARDQGRG